MGHGEGRPIGPDDIEHARVLLIEGNQRFATGQVLHPHADAEWRRQILAGQKPFAAVLGCADSRVAPEVVFDCGLGDLFVVRSAGHVIGGETLASIEYAATHLHVPLLLVLGHARCGAVQAALSGEAQPPGHLSVLTDAIRPAIERARKEALPAAAAEDLLAERAARMHARMTAARLPEASPLVAERVAAGALRILAAYYDLASGRVEMLA